MQKKTILYVEDEEQQSATLSRFFSENGYQTIVCNNAEEALAKVRTTVPDLFLVDIKLTGMDGLTFFEEIQKLEQVKKTPFVFLTAYNSLQAAMDAKRRGATEYITKPYDLDFLIERIREIIPPA
jgi:CheY-like chemotaxis protein